MLLGDVPRVARIVVRTAPSTAPSLLFVNERFDCRARRPPVLRAAHAARDAARQSARLPRRQLRTEGRLFGAPPVLRQARRIVERAIVDDAEFWRSKWRPAHERATHRAVRRAEETAAIERALEADAHWRLEEAHARASDCDEQASVNGTGSEAPVEGEPPRVAQLLGVEPGAAYGESRALRHQTLCVWRSSVTQRSYALAAGGPNNAHLLLAHLGALAQQRTVDDVARAQRHVPRHAPFFGPRPIADVQCSDDVPGSAFGARGDRAFASVLNEAGYLWIGELSERDRAPLGDRGDGDDDDGGSGRGAGEPVDEVERCDRDAAAKLQLPHFSLRVSSREGTLSGSTLPRAVHCAFAARGDAAVHVAERDGFVALWSVGQLFVAERRALLHERALCTASTASRFEALVGSRGGVCRVDWRCSEACVAQYESRVPSRLALGAEARALGVDTPTFELTALAHAPFAAHQFACAAQSVDQRFAAVELWDARRAAQPLERWRWPTGLENLAPSRSLDGYATCGFGPAPRQLRFVQPPRADVPAFLAAIDGSGRTLRCFQMQDARAFDSTFELDTFWRSLRTRAPFGGTASDDWCSPPASHAASCAPAVRPSGWRRDGTPLLADCSCAYERLGDVLLTVQRTTSGDLYTQRTALVFDDDGGADDTVLSSGGVGAGAGALRGGARGAGAVDRAVQHAVKAELSGDERASASSSESHARPFAPCGDAALELERRRRARDFAEPDERARRRSQIANVQGALVASRVPRDELGFAPPDARLLASLDVQPQTAAEVAKEFNYLDVAALESALDRLVVDGRAVCAPTARGALADCGARVYATPQSLRRVEGARTVAQRVTTARERKRDAASLAADAARPNARMPKRSARDLASAQAVRSSATPLAAVQQTPHVTGTPMSDVLSSVVSQLSQPFRDDVQEARDAIDKAEAEREERERALRLGKRVSFVPTTNDVDRLALEWQSDSAGGDAVGVAARDAARAAAALPGGAAQTPLAPDPRTRLMFSSARPSRLRSQMNE